MWDRLDLANMINNTPLMELYQQNALSLGVGVDSESDDKEPPSGSTDMGNVSYELPSIHPIFRIGTNECNHTRGFTAAAGW